MFAKSRVIFLAAATTMGLAACTNTETPPEHSEQLAAHAASTNYPSEMNAKTSDRIGTIIDSKTGVLRVINFSNNEIDNADIWVNQAFYYRLDSLPPNGYVRLDMSKFYDKTGDPLTAHDVRVNMVQIKAGDTLWTLLGPINH